MDKEIREQVEQIKREWDESVDDKKVPSVFVGENITIEQALNRLRQELQKDNGPYSYFYAWQSNIAMSFYDSYVRQFNTLQGNRHHLKRIADIANDAAKSFLELLCNQPNNTNLKRQNELPSL